MEGGGFSGLEDRHVFQLQQTMLGALRRYDPDDLKKIHPASLQRALDSLGLSFGDELVDKMMVMCQSDPEGMVDYSRFSRYLNRGAPPSRTSGGSSGAEASLARQKRGIHTTLTDGQQALQPFESAAGINLEERQRMQLQDCRRDLIALFDQFDNKTISVDEFKQGIRELDIIVTPALDRVLGKTAGTDVSFKEIKKALSVVNEARVDKTAGHGYASHTDENHHTSNEGTFGQQGLTRRRTDPYKNSATFGRSQEESAGKGMNKEKKGQVGNQLASPDLVASLAGGERFRAVTQSRADMNNGIGRSHNQTLSSEQRVLRQQIFAAIRRMDKGELSAAQFKDRMMQIGVEIPPDVFKLMLQHRSSGAATFNTFASAFERLLEERESSRGYGAAHELQQLMDELRADLLSRQQPLVLQRLAQMFKTRDLLNTGTLVLQGFTEVLSQVWNTLTEEQVLAIFNSQDPEGAGKANYNSFVAAMRGSFCEDRLAVVRQAFLTLPKDAKGNVVAETLHSSFQAQEHPEVTSGKKTQGQVITEFLDTFEVGADGCSVTQAEFEDYYHNISAVVQSTPDFIALIKHCWGLDETIEPPPVHFYKSFYSGKYTEAPTAAQTHGNILNWRQAPGEIEIKNQKKRPTKTLLGDHIDAHSANISVTKWGGEPEAIHDEIEGQFGGGRGGGHTRGLHAGNLASKALQWGGQPPPLPSSRGDAASQATADDGLAGAVLREYHPMDVRPRVMSNLAKHHHGTSTPFGTDEPSVMQPAKAASGGKVMSLKDHFKAAQS